MTNAWWTTIIPTDTPSFLDYNLGVWCLVDELP